MPHPEVEEPKAALIASCERLPEAVATLGGG